MGIAGRTVTLIEEDAYYNGEPIPPERRNGCYDAMPSDALGIPLLKVEAGWSE